MLSVTPQSPLSFDTDKIVIIGIMVFLKVFDQRISF